MSSPPVENGRLVVADGRVAGVERAAGSGGGDIDLGDVVVLPGWVNAHTHLQLTFCRGQTPYRGGFVDWIRDLAGAIASGRAGSPEEAIQAGMRQSLAAGVTAVADIGQGPVAAKCWRNAPLHLVGFFEVLGMGPRKDHAHERSLGGAVRLCESMPHGDGANSGAGMLLAGLSPHAPYSTDPSIYEGALEVCRRAGRPLCTHLAETREEARFLADGTGPFRELLEEWGLWDGSFRPPGCSPVEYARRLGLLGARPVLAHVNYADDDDLDLLAGSGASVAYCPRTHRFFEHPPHRYRDMLARGVNVCVGTDSLASNDSLSILDELRFLRREDRFTPDDGLLRMGTVAGARALGLEDQIGSLAAGRRADFVVIPLENLRARDPVGDILAGKQPPEATFLNGKRVENTGDA